MSKQEIMFKDLQVAAVYLSEIGDTKALQELKETLEHLVRYRLVDAAKAQRLLEGLTFGSLNLSS